MAKLVVWDRQQAKQELQKRLTQARDSRRVLESKWEENERAVYGTSLSAVAGFAGTESDVGLLGLSTISPQSGDADVAVNYIFKNVRFVHAQLSSNPPSVLVRPASSDPEDRRRADAADRIVRFALRQYSLQEHVDLASLKCLVHGTGFLKMVWDSEAGEIISVSDDGEVEMEGDVCVTTPSTWSIYVDPDAERWEDVRYVFERLLLPYEEACFRFPEAKDLLESARVRDGERPSQGLDGSVLSTLTHNRKWDVVELFEYWETGLPVNGYLGRHGICTRGGELVAPLGPSPHRFPSQASRDLARKKKLDSGSFARLPQIAKLPYHCLTDVDVPDRVWGKSFVEYASKLQDTLNRLDNVNLENIRAQGVTRIILPEGCEIADDSLTDTPYDVVKITGNQPPFKMEAPGPLTIVDNFRAGMKLGIDDMCGVNEANFGQQSREQSGFSLQLAANQGNMIRRRLFNKYVTFTTGIYRSFLGLVQKHWTTPRTVQVLGREKAFEAVDLSGADVDGGFDFEVEYGASLSLDPNMRRQEILSLQPLLEKAGLPLRTTLKMLKLNELEGMMDHLQLAEDRQREIFEEMVATGRYIHPREFQDHENMLAYALTYVMTTEYKYLPDQAQALIDQHIRDRIQQSAIEKKPGGEGAPAPAAEPGGLAELLAGPAGAAVPGTPGEGGGG